MKIIVSMQMDTALEVMVDIKLRRYDLFMHLRVQQFYGVYALINFVNFLSILSNICVLTFPSVVTRLRNDLINLLFQYNFYEITLFDVPNTPPKKL